MSKLSAVTLLAYKRSRRGERSGRDAQSLRKLLAMSAEHQVFPYDTARFAELERRVFQH